jgi:septal ring-binding cell division protein DamX
LATLTTENKADADKLVDVFKKKRMRVRLADKTIKGKRNYVVEVGEYTTEVDAAKDLEAVRAICKCKPTVVKR